MKYLICIVPPLTTRDRILELQNSFPSNKVQYYNEPHITLKSPSGMTEDKSWLAKVIALIGNTPRFDIKFDGLDQFEDRVLFLKPVYSEELMDLHMKLVNVLNVSLE